MSYGSGRLGQPVPDNTASPGEERFGRAVHVEQADNDLEAFEEDDEAPPLPPCHPDGYKCWVCDRVYPKETCCSSTMQRSMNMPYATHPW